MNPEDLREIQELHRRGLSIRAIARKLGRSRKTVRRALGPPDPPRPSEPPKLERFREIAREKHLKGLSANRIFREIRALGYRGGLTLLKNFLATLEPERPAKKAFRRFETRPGKEAQCDWSPYRLKIGGRETVAHCFSLVLGCSRKMFMAFYRNERLPTFLWAHTEAFAYLQGLCARIVYDNQTCVTLGRIRGKPLWNPSFLEFVRHHGFKPYAHRVRHKERSGKVERPFWYVENDFLKGATFESWEDLNRRARVWLDTIANVRKHSTTGRFVHEAYEEERPFLIQLPSVPFHAERREMRKVLSDGYVSVDGSLYPVPDRLVGQTVAVRIEPHHLEILDGKGAVAVRHRVPDTPMRVPFDGGPPRAKETAPPLTALEARFLAVFPAQRAFLDGLLLRMKGLATVHLRLLDRLVQSYGRERVTLAIERASRYRNWNGQAVSRILVAAHPDVMPEILFVPLRGDPAVLGALGEIDTGALRDYTLDTMPPTIPSDPNPTKKEKRP